MTPRGPNQNQSWYCERCGRETTHKIEIVPSETCMLKENIRAYRRFRECTECLGIISPLGEPEGNIYTVEINESDFDKVCSELNSLRDFREAVRKALDVTDRKSEKVKLVRM